MHTFFEWCESKGYSKQLKIVKGKKSNYQQTKHSNIRNMEDDLKDYIGHFEDSGTASIEGLFKPQSCKPKKSFK